MEDREKLFNERVKAYDNRRDNVKQNSAYLVGMPPDKAVKILLAMEDQDVIDLMRVTEELAVAAGEDLPGVLLAVPHARRPRGRAAAQDGAQDRRMICR